MGLASRLASRNPSSQAHGERQQRDFARRDIADVARQLHHKIVDRLDLAAVTQLPPEELRRSLRSVVEQLVMHEGIAMTDGEKNAIAEH
ncbi:MAG: hypothetical protein KJO07_12765, partial [Deltaproteobacteria bacterium]|nr:hypothetical protein [Deltaproteobacteria bacterium]